MRDGPPLPGVAVAVVSWPVRDANPIFEKMEI
jgi:hypothetical protein